MWKKYGEAYVASSAKIWKCGRPSTTIVTKIN